MPVYGEPEPPYPDEYTKGVWLFNNRHFFECHEILEEIWLESIASPKLFYQMIIHAAVCFVHWENGNRRGVLSLQHTFNQKADQIRSDTYMGMNIPALKKAMADLVEPLREDPQRVLLDFLEIETPIIEVAGFEPLEVEEDELKRLGRHT